MALRTSRSSCIVYAPSLVSTSGACHGKFKLRRYQLKTLFFLVNDDDEENFVNVILPQFAEIDDGEETLYLAACNKVTRGTRMVKVYVDQTFKNITASCEFYYANDESLEFNLQKSLSILAIIRTLYRNCIKELSED